MQLFNGKDLTGWKVNEKVDTFSVKDGAIVAHGQKCFGSRRVRRRSEGRAVPIRPMHF
jgi:Domain of Unknown Function (DUF1080)